MGNDVLKQRPQERGDLYEFSVVYTDRAVNLLSAPFQTVMRDISSTLREVYHAPHCALIPGSGTYAMETVARQFGTGKKCMVIRNGYFSFRWSDIFDVCKIPSEEIVMKAQFEKDQDLPQFQPHDLDTVVAAIKESKPAVVFAPQVETSTGMILTSDYITAVADAVHEVGGLFVVDAIAAGTMWVNMEELGIDILVTAPQKGWSGPACVGIVMLNETAKKAMDNSEPTSFCCNLPKWLTVMKKYEDGGFMYYTTLPTDSLTAFRNSMLETKEFGYENAKNAAQDLGAKIRAICAENGCKSVSVDANAAPTVVVVYAPAKDMVARFKSVGLQVVGGVPFKVDEPEGLVTFRIGLFGIDKLKNVDRVAATFEKAMKAAMP
mmetsp:Transcript_6311/g.7675  ORF Transcript_6311/g.7675 Transcript_6311/m.7675 type:complete len:378 (-) Transcript_6311:416-1549(-)